MAQAAASLHPAFISVDGLPNFRDAGGYVVVSGAPVSPNPDGKRRIKMVRKGVLFRSSEPSKITSKGEETLNPLGIKIVYDLRSQTEIESGYAKSTQESPLWPIKELEGAKREFVPVFLDQDYSPEALALRFKNYAAVSDDVSLLLLNRSSRVLRNTVGFVKAYKDILEAATDVNNESQPYRKILGHLASAPSASLSAPEPCLVHCTAGKDRTGVIVALVLSLCGVPDEAVIHEYNLTEIGLQARISELVKHLSSNPALGIDEAAAKRMAGARKGAMRGTLTRIRAQHGSIEQCVLDTGMLTPEGIAQLRKNMIVECDAEEAVPWEEHAKLRL
ncbi:tyrosine phosphatase [Xylariaceae sp. FL1019]|nr:tyrosine phosphatase [Xylariaceae sp. FL1019]